MKSHLNSKLEFDEAGVRSLTRARLLQKPPDLENVASGASDYDLNPGMRDASAGPLTPAAVLVPILLQTPLTVLLTERTAHLSAHAGQIAFPGGKIEANDADACAAALREAHEETGLDPSFAETLGFGEPYRTGTGFIITPVVAFIGAGFALSPDPAEVASVFTVPLAFLLDERNHEQHSRQWRGAERRFYAIPYQNRYIWGATAGIIRTLSRRLLTP